MQRPQPSFCPKGARSPVHTNEPAAIAADVADAAAVADAAVAAVAAAAAAAAAALPCLNHSPQPHLGYLDRLVTAWGPSSTASLSSNAPETYLLGK